MKQELAGRVTELMTATKDFPPLGPERREGILAVAELEKELAGIFDEANSTEASRDLIRAIVLLWHDHLDESHSISQNIHNADGSYVHGIMHRREPDYGNAKYWFHRVGEHPIFTPLAEAARAEVRRPELRSQLYKNLISPKGDWDPFAFIDAIEAAPQDVALRSLQGSELMLLLMNACRGA